MKRFLAILLCFALCLGQFGGVCFAAGETGLKLEVYKTGDTVTLTISVTAAVEDIFGMNLSLDYDDSAFARGGISSPVDRNAQWGTSIALEPSGGSLEANAVVAVLSFTATAAYVRGNEYSFAVGCIVAIDNDGEEIPISGNTVTLKEEPGTGGEGTALVLAAEKNGGDVTLTISVTEAVPDIYAMALFIEYDKTAFARGSVYSPVDSSAVWGSELIITPSAHRIDANAVIAELSFTAEDAYETGQEYVFTVRSDQDNTIAYHSGGSVFVEGASVTLKEAPPLVSDTEFQMVLTPSETEMTLTLSITDALPDVFGFELSLDYDHAAFTQIGVTSPVDTTAQWGTKLVIAPGAGSVAAGGTIAVLRFGLTENFDGCGEYTFTIHCDDCFDNNSGDISIPDASVTTEGHVWGAPEYVWAEDNSTVTATRVCGKNPEHKESETVTTEAVTTQPGCETAGSITYTAVFTNPAFETQTKTVRIDPLGHDWDDPEYVWAEDNSSVTATRVCKRVASHKETETVQTDAEITTPATCEAPGQTTYTARFANPAFETQTKTLTNVPALGHDWKAPEYVWAEDNSSVTATRVCGNDPAHTETETVTTSAEVTKQPGCETPGETTYTARFTNEAFTEQTKTVADVPALGHDWDAPTYVWAEDNSTVTATRVCKREASHRETETVEPVLEVIVAPTIDSEGQGLLRASFENPAFETQTKEVVLERLTGYSISLLDYTKGAAATNLDLEDCYLGEVDFTVTSANDLAVTVILQTGEELAVLPCTTVNGVHRFTIPNVQSEVTVILVLKGDVTLDGAVNMRDTLPIKKHTAGTAILTGIPLLAAQTDGNSSVNMRDTLPIKRQTAGTGRIDW